MSRQKRLALLVLVGLVLVLVGVSYIELVLARPVGEGPAGPAVAREPFERGWTDRRVLLVGIGDSITAGLGASSPDRSLFNRLVRNPDDEFPAMQGVSLSAVLPNLEHENLAISGTTSLHHVDVIRKHLDQQDEDVFGLIVMTTGGNDLIHSYGRRPPREGAMYGATLEQARPWIRSYEERLKSMLDAIVQRFPGGSEIYLADIYDPTDGVGDAPSVYLPHWPDGLKIHAEYNRIIRKVASKRSHVHVVPIHKTFLGHGSHCRQFWQPNYDADDPHYWYFENIEDPNDRGYDALRRVFLNTIADHSRLRQEGTTRSMAADQSPNARETVTVTNASDG